MAHAQSLANVITQAGGDAEVSFDVDGVFATEAGVTVSDGPDGRAHVVVVLHLPEPPSGAQEAAEAPFSPEQI